MWAKAFTLTLRVPQGDPTLNICNKINLPNTYGLDTKSNQKDQDNKDASTRPAGSLRFFRCFGTSYLHITQKAKPSFPPLRWPALVVRAYAFLIHCFKIIPSSLSAGKLRVKTDRTMVALCGCRA